MASSASIVCRRLLSSVTKQTCSVSSLHRSPSTQRYHLLSVYQLPSVSGIRDIHKSHVCHKKAGKGKGKTKKGTQKKAQALYDDFDEDMIPDTLEELVDMEKLKENFTNIVNDLRSEYSEKLALRTSQSAFSNLQINVQGGKKIALQYLAQITMKPPSTVTINLASNHQHVATVRDAVLKSALNVNPRIDGHTIFVETPRVTREHREKLSKNAKALADKHKAMIRDEQNNKTKLVRAASNIYSMYEIKSLEKDILQLVSSFNIQIDRHLKSKQNELLGD